MVGIWDGGLPLTVWLIALYYGQELLEQSFGSFEIDSTDLLGRSNFTPALDETQCFTNFEPSWNYIPSVRVKLS